MQSFIRLVATPYQHQALQRRAYQDLRLLAAVRLQATLKTTTSLTNLHLIPRGPLSSSVI